MCGGIPCMIASVMNSLRKSWKVYRSVRPPASMIPIAANAWSRYWRSDVSETARCSSRHGQISLRMVLTSLSPP